jgi:hypothetical protein
MIYPGERILPLPHQGNYCKSLGVKSIELCESPFSAKKNMSAPSEGEDHGDQTAIYATIELNRKGEACKMNTDYKSRAQKKNEDRAL